MLNTHRVFLSIIVIFTLVLAIGNAAGRTVSAGEVHMGDASGERKEGVTCSELPSRYSIRNEYVKGLNLWLPHTEDGPTGVDGGLIHLFSSYHTCSR